MNPSDFFSSPEQLFGLIGLVVFAVLIFALTFLFSRRKGGARTVGIREIEAYESLSNTVGKAVEAGLRLHISLGTGAIGEPTTATTLVGLAVVDRVASAAVVSDKTPVVTTADMTAAFLARDILRDVYARQNALYRYEAASTQVAGLGNQPFSAALTGIIEDEAVGGTVLIGSVGPEAVLFAEAGHRAKINTLAGSDDPAAQALLYATAENPVVGEDLYAAGAYIGRMPSHVASLRAQDIARLGIAVIIIGGLVWRLLP